MTDNFHRWSPLVERIPVGEARELPFPLGYEEWKRAQAAPAPQLAKPITPDQWRIV